MLKKFILLIALAFTPFFVEGKLPDLTPSLTTRKVHEMMKGHASHKKLTLEITKRIIDSYLEEIDPGKTYFIEPDIVKWTNPSDQLLSQTMHELQNGNFKTFEEIHACLGQAIQRRRELEKTIGELPKHVKLEEFKDMKWAATEEELLTRLKRIKSLQSESAAKLSESAREKSFQRINKRQQLFEEEMLDSNAIQRQKRILSNVLKATAVSLDSHTAYFTPDEADQFMISVQQRLLGIGAQLRDDINGFSIIKIIEGGPAWNSKELKVKDRIIAVNGEPVVGMDIIDAVELIRGKEGTQVSLTVVRQTGDADNKKEEILEIVIVRNEVVLKETRYESAVEAFGDGDIAYLKLFSFYQDSESSSAEDLSKEIEKLQESHNLKGLILDLRYNSGGMLSQAVDVSGLFISKGIVVSIKDENGSVQHLRHLDEDVVWKGPLIVLVNRASASASEIVAGTLQDYGRAIIVGDDHTYGKGSFQTFTLNTVRNEQANPEGEYKVTRGRYYTVAGRTPQLTGFDSDIVVPGVLSEMEIGEKFLKYPLENDRIPPNFDDDLSDVPADQRDKIRMLYKFNLQKKLSSYVPYLETLKKNSAERIKNNKIYQNYLKELKKKDKDSDKDAEPDEDSAEEASFGKADLQLTESYNIMKDLLYLKLKRMQAQE